MELCCDCGPPGSPLKPQCFDVFDHQVLGNVLREEVRGIIQPVNFAELDGLAELLLLEPQGRDVEVSHFPDALALYDPQRRRGIHMQGDLNLLPEDAEEGRHAECFNSPSDGTQELAFRRAEGYTRLGFRPRPQAVLPSGYGTSAPHSQA